MKSRKLVLLLAAASAALVMSQTAMAQNRFGSGYSAGVNGPTVSPYLNLLQVNSQGIIPYQELVRPQIDTQNALKSQAGAIQNLQQGAARGGSRSTGHSTAFMNYSHYYNISGPRRQR